MLYTTCARLVRRGILTSQELRDIISTSKGSGEAVESLLAARGVAKHELLHCLTETHGCPFVEFDEGVTSSQQLLKQLDADRLKRALWFPLSVQGDAARVIAWNPGDPALTEDVKTTLSVEKIDFLVALPSDIVRIIEHNQDLNPRFPRTAGRTPLAKVRTFLADRRSLFSCYRTSLARGRTGLAFLRTGISFITIAMVLFRIFGIGYLTILVAALLASGLVMTVDGFKWYLRARKVGAKPLDCVLTEASNGSTVLQASWQRSDPEFSRSEYVEGSDALRAGWANLSPVMRRRFLASDRTDLAEERTFLACIRTKMAKARTGLAFTRTGIAFVGLGTALLRLKQFQAGMWTMFDALLVLLGAAMTLEGFYWYYSGRGAGKVGLESVQSAQSKSSIWEVFFPPAHERLTAENGSHRIPQVTLTQSPGIWATTGLALERTVLAERRNVMARLRTIMARSRTGLAFIRTGMSISAVGAGLLIYFGASHVAWTAVNGLLILAGLSFIADGLYWHLPAEKMRKQLPYCFCDVEIVVPDYGVPARFWKKAVFAK